MSTTLLPTRPSSLVFIALLGAIALTTARAEIIGIEGFDYPDGVIAGQSGGLFWDWSENTATPEHTGTVSNWDDVTPAPMVEDGKLITTAFSSAQREFNGSSELDGAFDGDGVVYFRTTMTREAGATWSGLSSYDFGAERIFFGVPSAPNTASGKREFGIELHAPFSGTTYSSTGIEPVAGQTYTIVAKLNFDTNLLSMWADPDLSQTEENNSPDVSVPYTGTNWSTAVRLGSGGGGTTAWDDLIVATSWDEIRPRIANPSFEDGPVPPDPGYTDNIPGWMSSGAANRTGVNPAFSSNPFADNGMTPDGGRVAFIQSTGDLGSLSTLITGLQPGTHYKVSFRANSRALYDPPSASWSVNGSDFVISDASPVDLFGTHSTPYHLVQGTFLATATTALLVIQNQTAGDSTLLIDDFRIEVDHSVFTTTEDTGELTITGYDLNGDGTKDCPVGALVIPASIDGKPVTSIGNGAFDFCSDLTAVTLPAGLTSIGDSAFRGCSALIGVTLPAGLTSIGEGAFIFCSSLTAVTVPGRVTSIGRFAFALCRGLEAITVEGSNSHYSSLDGVLFDQSQTTLLQFPCDKSDTYTAPASVTGIGVSAFEGCSGLTAVDLPAGLTSIGRSAFAFCTSLTAVTLPAGLASIGDLAFRGCSGLTAVFFFGDAPALGEEAFGEGAGATVYYVPGTTGWPAPGAAFGDLPTALWDPAARITSIDLTETTIDLTWLPFLPVANPSYRIDFSLDGQTWFTYPDFENVTDTSASIGRPPNARLLFRVSGNGG